MTFNVKAKNQGGLKHLHSTVQAGDILHPILKRFELKAQASRRRRVF